MHRLCSSLVISAAPSDNVSPLLGVVLIWTEVKVETKPAGDLGANKRAGRTVLPPGHLQVYHRQQHSRVTSQETLSGRNCSQIPL